MNTDTVNNIDLAKYIDHTLLKPEATFQQIEKICNEAIENQFFGVCINSSWVPKAKKILINTNVKLVAVVGFPLGAACSESKAFETKWCLDHGADEIDMVIHLGAVKSQDNDYLLKDMAAVRAASDKKILKVIIETGLLNSEEKELACLMSVEAGANFVKTCTGFNLGSATNSDVELMRRIVGPNIGVKASGGIKTAAQAFSLIASGANRLGTSSGIALIQGQSVVGGY